MSRLANAGIAQLFTIPPADWKALNDQASAVMRLQNGVEFSVLHTPVVISWAQLTAAIPPLTTLADRSAEWQAATFPQILRHAATVCAYAQEAASNFSAVEQELSSASSVLTQLYLDVVRTELQELSETTSRIAAEFEPIAAQIDAFRVANTAFDEYCAAHPFVLGWQLLLPHVTINAGLPDILAHMRGVWNALASDVAAASGDGIDVTSTYLASLGLDVAIADWQNVATEARAFLSAFD
jgi:hypothetical protein